MTILQKGCAPRNFRQGRPTHLRVEAVVVHIIDGSLAAADATFLDNTLPDPRSAHYAVGQSGVVHQYVADDDTAFHAGRIVEPSWPGLKRGLNGSFVNPNFYTIGIEHEARAHDEWSDAMYTSSAELLMALVGRHPALNPLSRQNVVMHREIRRNKSCPGHVVDLAKLIAMARGPVPTVPNQLRTRTAVNVRRGSPSTRAPIARVVPAGELVNVVREVGGEAVNGMSRWFQNVDDDFLWGGALEAPPM